MTTTNNITNTQQLSDFLKSKGVHHYLETIKPEGSFVDVNLCEVPIKQIAHNSMSKAADALTVCLELIEAGFAVVKSECNNFIYITPKHNIVAENN